MLCGWQRSAVRALRRFLFPVALARARFAARRGRFALVALGLAVGAATLAAVLAGSLVARDRAIERAVGEIPAAARAVRAVWFGVPGQAGLDPAGLDRVARRALGRVSTRPPVEVVLFRRTSIGGALVDLGAVEGLEPWVRLRSGRLPRRCQATRCEVLRLGEAGRVPTPRGVRLVVVGEAALKSDVLFGEFVEPGAYHQPATPPFLLAEGADALVRARELESIYRSYAWVLPLTQGSIRPWDASELRERVARARSELQAEELAFDVSAPVSEIAEAEATSRAAGRRLLLVGGEACALLVAFALLAAATLRRDAVAVRRRLTWFGARRWQLDLLTGAEALAVALVGTLAGWGLGVGIAAVMAERADLPVRAVLAHSVMSPGGLAAGLALAGLSAVVLFAAVRARALRLAGLSVSPLDVAAVGALVAVLLAVARGSTDAAALAREGGTGVLLLLLPGLVAFVAAVGCARALGPGLRALERLARRSSVPVRLAALSLARNPGYAAITVAFLTVSLGLALFAETYRSTLARGQADQAAYAVPADFVVREDLDELVKPLEAAPLGRFRELAEDVEARPIVRLSGSAARLEGSRAVTVVGLPAASVASLRGWRSDFASLDRAALAERIRPRRPVSLRGIAVPADAAELRLPVTVTGHPLGIVATIENADGTFTSIDLGRTEGRRRVVLRARLPQGARGGHVIALTFRPPRRIEEPGAAAGRSARGVLATRGLELRGNAVTRAGFDGWIATNAGVSAIEVGARTEFHYALSNQVVSRFRPRQPSDDEAVPVLATPRLAAVAGPGGTLPIELAGERFTARVVATVSRFPTVAGEGVVADAELLGAALNADYPGVGVPNEVWIDAGSDESASRISTALARPPFDVLDVASHADRAERLRGDPLARAALATLASAALVALALALVGLLLGVVADVRDERGEFFDLEAQGASPAMLRRQVEIRALIVTLVGLVGGVATGVVLSALVVELVRITASSAAPEPPLVLAVAWPIVGLALAAYAVAAAALVIAATATSSRVADVSARSSEVGA